NDYLFCCLLEGAPIDGSGFRTRLLLCVCSPCALPKCAFKEGKVLAIQVFKLSSVIALFPCAALYMAIASLCDVIADHRPTSAHMPYRFRSMSAATLVVPAQFHTGWP